MTTPASEPVRFDTDPIEWARQVIRMMSGEPPTRPVLISHEDMWEMELLDPDGEAGE